MSTQKTIPADFGSFACVLQAQMNNDYLRPMQETLDANTLPVAINLQQSLLYNLHSLQYRMFPRRNANTNELTFPYVPIKPAGSIKTVIRIPIQKGLAQSLFQYWNELNQFDRANPHALCFIEDTSRLIVPKFIELDALNEDFLRQTIKDYFKVVDSFTDCQYSRCSTYVIKPKYLPTHTNSPFSFYRTDIITSATQNGEACTSFGEELVLTQLASRSDGGIIIFRNDLLLKGFESYMQHTSLERLALTKLHKIVSPDFEEMGDVVFIPGVSIVADFSWPAQSNWGNTECPHIVVNPYSGIGYRISSIKLDDMTKEALVSIESNMQIYMDQTIGSPICVWRFSQD